MLLSSIIPELENKMENILRKRERMYLVSSYVPFAEYVQWSVTVSIAQRRRCVEGEHHLHDRVHVAVRWNGMG